jgi:hypothetical protein
LYQIYLFQETSAVFRLPLSLRIVVITGKLREEGEDTLRYTLGIKAVIGTEEFLGAMLNELVGNPYT